LHLALLQQNVFFFCNKDFRKTVNSYFDAVESNKMIENSEFATKISTDCPFQQEQYLKTTTTTTTTSF